MSTTTPALKITPRRSLTRGHADHGWLNTFHSFSFASYYDTEYTGFGPLRVINEDRVSRGSGFGPHPHAEYLIWSYMVSGELEHKDSMGNEETLKRGDVQFTSAGTGIRHSEGNWKGKNDNHFLQIWAKPNVRGLAPHYKTSSFPDESKTDRLVRVMESVDRMKSNDEKTTSTDPKPIPLHSDLSMSASILAPGKRVTHELVADGPRKVYVHVVMTSGAETPKNEGAKVSVGGEVLAEGDGAFIEVSQGTKEVEFESVGKGKAEFVVFDMGQ